MLEYNVNMFSSFRSIFKFPPSKKKNLLLLEFNVRLQFVDLGSKSGFQSVCSYTESSAYPHQMSLLADS